MNNTKLELMLKKLTLQELMIDLQEKIIVIDKALENIKQQEEQEHSELDETTMSEGGDEDGI